MNKRNGFSLRGMIEDCRVLNKPIPLGRREHPLGLNIGIKHKWTIDGEPDVVLPRSAEGLLRLKSVVSRTSLGVDVELRENAWRALLADPALVVPLRPPSSEELVEAGLHALPASSKLRHVGLAVVFSSEPTTIDENGFVVGPRVAATTQVLVVQGPHKGALPVDVVVSARWVDDTQAFSELLEALWMRATPAVQRVPGSSVRQRVVILAGDSLPDDFDPDETTEKWRALAAVLGFNAQIVLRPSSQRPNIALRLKGEPPSVLVVWTNRVDSAPAFVSAYRQGTANPLLVALEAHSAEDFLRGLRRELLRLRRLSPALLLMPQSTVPEKLQIESAGISTQEPKLPIDSWTKRKLHYRFGYFYESSGGPLWYSRVVAEEDRHGGCHFKLHRRVGEELRWEANLGEDGSMLSTHKGPRGWSIPMSQLHGE